MMEGRDGRGRGLTVVVHVDGAGAGAGAGDRGRLREGRAVSDGMRCEGEEEGTLSSGGQARRGRVPERAASAGRQGVLYSLLGSAMLSSIDPASNYSFQALTCSDLTSSARDSRVGRAGMRCDGRGCAQCTACKTRGAALASSRCSSLSVQRTREQSPAEALNARPDSHPPASSSMPPVDALST